MLILAVPITFHPFDLSIIMTHHYPKAGLSHDSLFMYIYECTYMRMGFVPVTLRTVLTCLYENHFYEAHTNACHQHDWTTKDIVLRVQRPMVKTLKTEKNLEFQSND
eukprot:TRINITY_DN32942_c1_g1_i1.p1 TRINITY_DN32942_c1_g1~~TRINITY_DN32942_c1_g1_i1.p1  ORF type:complete len:107 (-),score=7.05 TRINITY_DN32942_c1_g1_i1:1317-1637(-)